MKISHVAAAMSLSLVLAGPLVAQQTTDAQPTNEQTRKQTHADLKQQEKADKAQAKADKAERKAVGSHKMKKAAKEQDKANATQPQ